MLNPAEFFRSTITRGLPASGTMITLMPGASRALDTVGKGNHCYLLLETTGRTEVVKYIHQEDYADRTSPDTISVVRDVLSMGRKNFAPGTCIRHEWFGLAIKEWVNQERLNG